MRDLVTTISVSVPARPDSLRVLRAVTSSVAARKGATFDRLGEVRIAVDEAATLLLRLPTTSSDGRIDCMLDTSTDDRILSALLITDADRPPAPAQLESSWGWKVLDAICDEVALTPMPGKAAIAIVMRDAEAPNRAR